MSLQSIFQPTKYKVLLVIILLLLEFLFASLIPIPIEICLKCVGCGCHQEFFYGLGHFDFYRRYFWVIYLLSFIILYLLVCFFYQNKTSKSVQ